MKYVSSLHKYQQESFIMNSWYQHTINKFRVQLCTITTVMTIYLPKKQLSFWKYLFPALSVPTNSPLLKSRNLQSISCNFCTLVQKYKFIINRFDTSGLTTVKEEAALHVSVMHRNYYYNTYGCHSLLVQNISEFTSIIHCALFRTNTEIQYGKFRYKDNNTFE